MNHESSSAAKRKVHLVPTRCHSPPPVITVPFKQDSELCLSEGGLVALCHLVPVDQVEEGGDVIGAAVLHIDVVGVLPHIHGQDGGLAVAPRVLGVGGLGHLQLAVVDAQPGPARAKLGGACTLEGVLEGVKGAKVAVDGVSELAGGGAALVGAHGLPEEGVVDHLGGVIELGGGLAPIPGLQHHLFDGHVLVVGALDLVVQVGHVSLVVLAVVELEGPLQQGRWWGYVSGTPPSRCPYPNRHDGRQGSSQ